MALKGIKKTHTHTKTWNKKQTPDKWQIQNQQTLTDKQTKNGVYAHTYTHKQNQQIRKIKENRRDWPSDQRKGKMISTT